MVVKILKQQVIKTSETIYHPKIRVVVILCSGLCKIDSLVKLRSKLKKLPTKRFRPTLESSRAPRKC